MSLDWTIEKISALSREEVVLLRANCLLRNTAVVALCDQLLLERALAPTKKIKKRKSSAPGANPENASETGGRGSFFVPADAIDQVARRFLELPLVEHVANGRRRCELQSSPVKTLSDLWRLFVVCGFSSQENSEDKGNLAAFFKAGGPLLYLDKVRQRNCDPDWVATEIAGRGLRFSNNKVALVVGNYKHFVEAGAESNLLGDLCRNNERLKIFCDLSRGTLNDHELSESAAFSKGLDAQPFAQIGPKQLRNILVNGGLAHNVVPLDSRWLGYLEGIFPSKLNLTLGRYLLIEDTLRRALASVQKQRPDLINLAVLDAVVFAEQAKSGVAPTAWYGMGSGDASPPI